MMGTYVCVNLLCNCTVLLFNNTNNNNNNNNNSDTNTTAKSNIIK